MINKEIDIRFSTVNSIAEGFGGCGYKLLIPPNDDRIIHYDHDADSNLDASDMAKIINFVSFVISESKNVCGN